MALKLNERYPGRFNSPTTQYPQGSFKNRTAPGAKDGSYLEQDWANDALAFLSSLLSGAGLTANGSVDTVGASQYYDALKKIFLQINNNLSDLTNKSAARSALELGTAATRDAGTGAGQLMPVGSFGVGGTGQYITPGTNVPAHVLNTPGLIFSCGNADAYNNAPSFFGSEWFDLFQMYHGTNQQTLLALSQNGKAAIGSTTNGTFQGWKEVFTSDTKITNPIGVPLPYPLATAPTGYLKCNGSSFSTTTYPQLAVAYPSGVLPDLRAFTIRGWDDGRGIDTGRTLLSEQADALQNITGGMIDMITSTTPSASGAFALTSNIIGYTDQTTRSGRIVNFNFDASRIARTAAETRVRNIAFNYIVRAI